MSTTTVFRAAARPVSAPIARSTSFRASSSVSASGRSSIVALGRPVAINGLCRSGLLKTLASREVAVFAAEGA